MKERRIFIDKVKHEKHMKAIQTTVLIVIAIAFFIVGFLVSWNFFKKPLNDNQLKLCEQLAHDAYNQKGNILVEVPEGFSVDMTATTITVKSTNNLYRGQVVARLQNGELVMTRDMEIGLAVFLGIVIGILFVLLFALIIMYLPKKSD